MRLATWNVNSLTARLPRVVDWISRYEPGVLCLQETKQTDQQFPHDVFRELGYESAHHGEGRWNGVAVLSRVGLADVQRGFGTSDDEQGARLVAATCAGVRVFCAYVPNGRSLDSEHYGAKLQWLAQLRQTLSLLSKDAEAVALGDFNIAPHDSDVWDVGALHGMTHVSAPERAALAALEEIGYEDVFRRFHPDGGVFSWWDYRDLGFPKNHGMRIDLLFASAKLAGRAVGAFVDRDERKKASNPALSDVKPSDHAPVVLDLADVA